MQETIDSILTFWFGKGTGNLEIAEERGKLWFGKDDDVDREIENRFKPVSQAVFDGKLDHWRESAKGLLASILCCDQFPRNIYRDTPRAFGYDESALGMSQQAVATGVDQELSLIQRVFAYLPYEHSEVLEMQDRSMELFTGLVEAASAEERGLFENYLDYARRHRDIIVRFGRFPHRNAILGRESTEEEKAFLEQPGSSF